MAVSKVTKVRGHKQDLLNYIITLLHSHWPCKFKTVLHRMQFKGGVP